MKLLIALLFIPILSLCQIDYPRGLELISNSKPTVKITWIKDASREVPLYFSQKVSFINTKTDTLIPSRVIATIRHNGRHFKSFEFKVGDGIVNHLYTSNPINLNKGDSVTIHFELKSTTIEEYVFNIFDNTPKPVVKSTPVKYASVTKQESVIAKIDKRNDTNNDLKRMRRNRTIVSILNIISH